MDDGSQIGPGAISKDNVGRIAERIVSNELEFHGFRVSDLNKEGPSANADLLAVRDGNPCQIQVKGAANARSKRWWVGYGFCTQEQIDEHVPVFNQHSSFYRADIVVLVAVRSPREYRCIVLPVKIAEDAAQINLSSYFRLPKADGRPRKPGRIVCFLESRQSEKNALRLKERELLLKHENGWDFQI
jgi:hypothetical protein